MGAWGVGIFDNDDAADWVPELVADGIAAVEAALAAVRVIGYLDVDLGARALAAADVVARLRVGGGEMTSYTEDVVTWVERNPSQPSDDLVGRAVAAIARVRSEDSELRALWEDSDSFGQWGSTLSELEKRLVENSS